MIHARTKKDALPANILLLKVIEVLVTNMSVKQNHQDHKPLYMSSSSPNSNSSPRGSCESLPRISLYPNLLVPGGLDSLRDDHLEPPPNLPSRRPARLLTRSPTDFTTFSNSSNTTSNPAAFSSILNTVSRQSWNEDVLAATETCCCRCICSTAASCFKTSLTVTRPSSLPSLTTRTTRGLRFKIKLTSGRGAPEVHLPHSSEHLHHDLQR